MQRPFGHAWLAKMPKISGEFHFLNQNLFCRRLGHALLNGADDSNDFYHRLNIVDTHDVCSVSDGPRDGGGGAEEPLIGLRLAADRADESLAAGADNKRSSQLLELPHFADEGEIVVDVLAKADARIEKDLIRVDPSRFCSRDSLDEERFHFLHHVFVMRTNLHGPRLALHVHEDNGSAALGGEAENRRIIATGGDVVDERRASVDGSGGYLAGAGIDRPNHRQIRRDCL